jgi:mannose-6-phosphate isomerase-like protein (cupin superfamily)
MPARLALRTETTGHQRRAKIAGPKFRTASNSFAPFDVTIRKTAAVQCCWLDFRIATSRFERANPCCQKIGRRRLSRFLVKQWWRPTMNQHAAVSKFSHVKPADTEFKGGGLRDFFLYRDLGIAAATGGQVICHLVKANADMPPEDGTGWHKHECDFQIVVMLKGWARFMYEDKPTLVQAGDVVHQRPGIVHYLFDYSPDMEYMEIVSPADFKTVDMPPATDKVPPVTPWK